MLSLNMSIESSLIIEALVDAKRAHKARFRASTRLMAGHSFQGGKHPGADGAREQFVLPLDLKCLSMLLLVVLKVCVLFDEAFVAFGAVILAFQAG
jgi:hypothetical protein